jgi:hypothetical protein
MCSSAFAFVNEEIVMVNGALLLTDYVLFRQNGVRL